MSGSKVVTSIDIAAPPEKVWEVVMDPTRLGEWVTIHRKLHSHSDSKMEQTLCVRGANFKVKWDLAECRPAKLARWEGKGPMGSHATTVYMLSAQNGGTRFDYENEFKAPGGPLGKMASRVVVGDVPTREANASLQRLKSLLESHS